MLNFLLCTEQDQKEAAALERRRQAEEERRKRIFNPRVRLIGVRVTLFVFILILIVNHKLRMIMKRYKNK